MSGGKRERLTATVGEFPADTTAVAREAPPKTAGTDLGLTVSELPPEGRKALGVDYGLIVEDVRGGPAAAPPIPQRGLRSARA